MSYEIRKRIIRPATDEDQERHRAIRKEIEQELPELVAWAKAAAAQHREKTAVGTVLTAEEAPVLDAIDDYAEKHALASRSAVIREALSQLLGIEIARR
jgi:hypothetical protein